MSNVDLTGVWLLKSFHLENVRTGERSEPFGHQPCGTIILHPDGRMVALITRGDGAAPVTEAEQASAFQHLIAYSGFYQLEPPDRLVVRVDISWFQPWIETRQVRFYSLNGDDLDLVSAPLHIPGTDAQDATVIARVSWNREKPRLRDLN